MACLTTEASSRQSLFCYCLCGTGEQRLSSSLKRHYHLRVQILEVRRETKERKTSVMTLFSFASGNIQEQCDFPRILSFHCLSLFRRLKVSQPFASGRLGAKSRSSLVFLSVKTC